MPPTRRVLLAASFAVPLAMPFVRPARAARAINLGAYGGAFQPLYDAAVVEPFRRAHPDIGVYYYPIANSTQGLALLQSQRPAPEVDVCLLDVAMASVATQRDLLEPVVSGSLPVLAELVPGALIPGVAGPALWIDPLALLYAPGEVKPAPTSWKALWEPGFARRIAIAAPPDPAGLAFTVIANRIFGGGDYRQSIDGGLTAIADMAPRVRSWDPRPDVYSYIIEGSASLGLGWNASGQRQAQDSQGRLAVAIPGEGSVYQVHTINLVKGSRDPEAARVFLAYALGIDAQRALAEQMFYGPVNPGARVGPAALSRTGATPERLARMIEVDWVAVARMRYAITEQWRRRILQLR